MDSGKPADESKAGKKSKRIVQTVKGSAIEAAATRALAKAKAEDCNGPNQAAVMKDIDGWKNLRAVGTSIKKIVGYLKDEGIIVNVKDMKSWLGEESPKRKKKKTGDKVAEKDKVKDKTKTDANKKAQSGSQPKMFT